MRLHQFDLHQVLEADESGDPHLFCVLLKEWLKRLPQPLIADYKACLAMAQQEEAEQRATMQRLWDDMAVNSRAVLRRLMLFAHELAAHSEKTRMTARNLCIVFAPGIMHPLEEQSALDMLRDQPLTQEALELVYDFVVTHYSERVATAPEASELVQATEPAVVSSAKAPGVGADAPATIGAGTTADTSVAVDVVVAMDVVVDPLDLTNIAPLDI